MLHKDGCHCGRVQFEVEAPADLAVTVCNCSICRKTGYLHLIVPRSRFRLITTANALSSYTFGTQTAQHFFCKTCGIKSFYVPRSNPDGFSVNVRCLDQSTVKSIAVTEFDGRDWERAFARSALKDDRDR